MNVTLFGSTSKAASCKVLLASLDASTLTTLGYFSFHQASPFDVTELRVNLTNLKSQVGPYHVHCFPGPSVRSPPSSLCSNDNVGGHWNPFGINTTIPTYPIKPGSTHDRYEIGDLSAKHMSLEGKNNVDMVFKDFNLPLFGQNSIVGRSVLHHPEQLSDTVTDLPNLLKVITGIGRHQHQSTSNFVLQLTDNLPHLLGITQ
uniref:Superoxide dismutase copper/zinc binding domain-containing protein n=1 Tax=Mastacembelus armatus TaxID=205130 RepID=A0A3Q3MJW2_9TELE